MCCPEDGRKLVVLVCDFNTGLQVVSGADVLPWSFAA